MPDHIVERIRAAAEELTGVPAALPTELDQGKNGRRSVVLLSTACVALLIAGLAWGTTFRRDEPVTPASPPWSAMTVQDVAGRWLDLPSPPDGLRPETNDTLASTAVCVSAITTDTSLTCTALEGQIGSYYLPASAPKNADETEYEIEIRTVFGDTDLATYVENLGLRVSSTVALRGTSGFVIDDERGLMVVWSDRPGTITTLRTKADSGRDLIELAEEVVPREWPASLRPPSVAIDFDRAWLAYDNNHPYALATSEQDSECIHVGYVPNRTSLDPNGPEPMRYTSAGEQIWTIGTISGHTPVVGDSSTGQEAFNGQDVFAGLVPSAVARIMVTLDDGRELSVDTVAVPGLTSRAWGTPTNAPQGTIAIGKIVGLTSNGDQAFTDSVVALAPTVAVDSICSQPGATGIVPDVVGQDLRAATESLRSAGLLVANRITTNRTTIVVRQQPTAGTDVGCGDVLLTFAD